MKVKMLATVVQVLYLHFFHFSKLFPTYSVIKVSSIFKFNFVPFNPLSPQEKTKFWVKLSGDEISVSSDGDGGDGDGNSKGKANSIAVASTTTALALLASALPQLV